MLLRFFSTHPIVFYIFLSFALALPSLSQTSSTPFTALPSAGLQADVAILRSILEQLHPGLYRYQSKAAMDAAFDQLTRDFAKDRTVQEAFLRLSAFTAQIRCGHTYPNFFNQSAAVTTALFEQPNRVPFFYRWVNRKMIVTKDFTKNQRLAPGTEVISINGIGAGEILTRLLPLVRADGANDATRINNLQVQAVSYYEAADIYLPMVFDQWSTPFHLKIQSPGRNRPALLTEAAVTFADRKSESHTVRTDPRSGQPLFTLTYRPGGVALLTMPTWAMYQTKWEWATWLTRALDEVVDRKSLALVIDLRGNEGGDDVGDLILARLRTSVGTQEPYARLVRYRKVPAELLSYLQTWDTSVEDWGDRAVDLPRSWPTAPPVKYLRQVKEEAPILASGSTTATTHHFSGRVLILIDASNSSATYAFARAIQQEHLGTLVGAPTGGNKQGINGGSFFFVHLPHSGLEVDLPLIGYFPATQQANEGLQPDIPVAFSKEDIAHGFDPVLARTESLIQARAGTLSSSTR